MARPQPLPRQEALSPRAKGLGPRAQRAQRVREDAQALVGAVTTLGAASSEVSREEQPERYLPRLRAALRRLGIDGSLLQRRRLQATAWRALPRRATRRASQRQRSSGVAQTARRGRALGRGRQG